MSKHERETGVDKSKTIQPKVVKPAPKPRPESKPLPPKRNTTSDSKVNKNLIYILLGLLLVGLVAAYFIFFRESSSTPTTPDPSEIAAIESVHTGFMSYLDCVEDYIESQISMTSDSSRQIELQGLKDYKQRAIVGRLADEMKNEFPSDVAEFQTLIQELLGRMNGMSNELNVQIPNCHYEL